MRKRLVYRCDDVGYTEVYDMGIKKAFEEGVGCSADVMFDAMDAKNILLWLKDRPWISIGWHRHLWERPVLPASEVPTLVDEEGRFKWRHRHQELMAEASYKDAYKEFEAEMDLCYLILGKYPDVASLRTADIALEHAYKDILDKYKIPYGVFASTHPNGAGLLSTALPEYEHLHYYSVGIQPEHGFGLEYFKDYDPLSSMMNLQWTEKEEIYFYGWHPGYCDDYIMEESRSNLHRCKELEACCSPVFKKWVIDNHVELINQRDAIHGTNEFQEHLKEVGSPLYMLDK